MKSAKRVRAAAARQIEGALYQNRLRLCRCFLALTHLFWRVVRALRMLGGAPYLAGRTQSGFAYFAWGLRHECFG